MRAFLAIVGRELLLRGSVLSLALLLGCVPVALALSGSGLVVSTQFAGMGVGLLAGAFLVGLTALVSGWNLIAPEQSAGRLGFLFSRPVPWPWIWGGKLTAAVALPVAAGAFAVLPSLVVDHGQWRAFWSTPTAGAQLFGAATQILLLVGLGNAASVAYRSRPAQRAIDLALLAGFLILLLKPSVLLTVAAWSFGYAHQAAVAQAPIAVALFVASVAQAGAGRTDPRRSHGAFSLTLWPLVFIAMVAIAGAGHLMVTTPPSLLRRVDRAEGARRGGWIFVSGPVRWGQYVAAFLYEPASGRYVSLGSGHHVSRLSFSPDGVFVAVVERDPLEARGGRTRAINLGDEVPAAKTVLAHLTEDVAISHHYLVAYRRDGSWAGPRLDLYGIPDGGLVTSLPCECHSPPVFEDDGRLRIVRLKVDYWGRDSLDLYLVTPDQLRGRPNPDQLRQRRYTGSLGDTHGVYADIQPYGTVPLEAWEDANLRETPSGSRLLVRRFLRFPFVRADPSPGPRICLHETTSGDHLRTLFQGPGTVEADFLADGLRGPSGGQAGIAVTVVREGRGSLRLLAVDGAELTPAGWSEDLGPALSVSVAGEPGPGYLFLGVRRNKEDFGYTFVVGPSGSWREPGIYPVAPRAETRDSPGAGRPTAGSLGARLFISEDGTLLRYDPETRARTVLLGRAGG